MKPSFLLCAAALGATTLALPLPAAFAQPDTRATVAPQPANRVRPNRANRANRANRPNQGGRGQRGARMAENAARRDQRMIEEFETLYNRKLTDAEKAEIKKAADKRNEAVRAAQEQFQADFAKATGVTENDLKQKRRAARMNQPANAPRENGAKADGAKPGAPVVIPAPPAD